MPIIYTPTGLILNAFIIETFIHAISSDVHFQKLFFLIGDSGCWWFNRPWQHFHLIISLWWWNLNLCRSTYIHFKQAQWSDTITEHQIRSLSTRYDPDNTKTIIWSLHLNHSLWSWGLDPLQGSCNLDPSSTIIPFNIHSLQHSLPSTRPGKRRHAPHWNTKYYEGSDFFKIHLNIHLLSYCPLKLLQNLIKLNIYIFKIQKAFSRLKTSVMRRPITK